MSALLAGLVLSTWTAAQQPTPADPTPDPKAVVQHGAARFTVLTDSIIRMQYGQTHDDPTFTIINRRLQVPDFQQSMESDYLVIKTNSVELRYLTTSQGTFSQDNLQVRDVKLHDQIIPLGGKQSLQITDWISCTSSSHSNFMSVSLRPIAFQFFLQSKVWPLLSPCALIDLVKTIFQ